MKKLFTFCFIYLIAGFIFICSLNAQIINCGDGYLELSNVVCMDEVFSFDVSSNNLCTSNISQLPVGFNITNVNGTAFMLNPSSVTFSTNTTFSINGSLPGCLPLNLSLLLCEFNGSFFQSCSSSLILFDNIAIPTLGEWSIILLALLVLIMGIISLKAKVRVTYK